MQSEIRLAAVALDCGDPRELASFYSSMLGVEVSFESDNFAAVEVAGFWITFHRVDGYLAPRWPDSHPPKQMHLDFAVGDLAKGEALAIAAGAVKADFQPSPDKWIVFFDLARHPFCLSRLIPD